jgi:hypothetical protein
LQRTHFVKFSGLLGFRNAKERNIWIEETSQVICLWSKMSMAMAIATASMNATVAFLTQLLQFIEKNIKKLHLNSNYLPSKRGLWPSRSLIELAKACELQKMAWLLPLLFICSIPFAPIPYGPVFPVTTSWQCT